MTTTIAIMQPYFLPYIGYFQLMSAVDRFVILDDVNYINRGWINRNRIPNTSTDATQWLTVPLRRASQNRLIRELSIASDNGWKNCMLRTIRNCYARSPESADMIPRFERWLNTAHGNLSDFLRRTLADIAERCDITTTIIPTSSVYPRNGLRGQNRILDICRQEGATTYVNPAGGRHLYDHTLFQAAGVELMFLNPEINPLQLAFSESCGPVISILDLLMRNPPDLLQQVIHSSELQRSDESVTAPATQKCVA
ncbi:MAG: WbqC family protein [Fuerstiella sp.]|nr:WbqC family protein [Fuerstiella sp.]MCP4786833.1 WbqC family protein [Fuerstiella sp.]MCP4854521.1 WbqC family protein [Fuerstiella sp.]